MKRSSHLSAFTLIELLIVVAIIAILAAIAVPNFLEAQTRAKVARVQNDMRAIATALESYAVDNNHYPSSWDPKANFWINLYLDRLRPITTPIAYMTSIPPDPFIGDKTQGIFFNGVLWNPDAYMTVQYAEDYYIPISMRNAISPPDHPGEGYVSREGANVCYKLESVGPDRLFNFQKPVTDSERIDYDPSNGTVSYGDIRRFGGEDRGNINGTSGQ
jgi:type II secretion system protein G